MQAKRVTILTGVLTLLVLGYVGSLIVTQLNRLNQARPAPPALPGENRLSKLDVERDPKGVWFASIDYYYTGVPSVSGQ